MNPPRLVLAVGGTSALQAAWKAEVPRFVVGTLKCKNYREIMLTPLFLTYSCILLLDLLGEYIRQKLLHIDTIRVGVTEI